MKKRDELLERMESWDENAENFRGTVLDEGRMAVLGKMKSKAAMVVSLSHGEIWCVPTAFDNHCKTASVIIRGEHPIVILDTRISKLIAELWNMSDDVAVAIPDGTHDIQMCFSIWDMWKEWRMENSPFTKK